MFHKSIMPAFANVRLTCKRKQFREGTGIFPSHLPGVEHKLIDSAHGINTQHDGYGNRHN
jgi:hypothetical protein